MKGLYWRPKRVSRRILAVIAALSLLGMAAVELFPVTRLEPYQSEKLAAAQLAQHGMDLIKQERLRLGHAIVPHFDPGETGIVGASMSRVTSVPGNLRAKQTSVNPNFAAAVVGMLKQSGVQEGDYVAVGCSGSFPALNLAVYAALQTLKAKPIIVASALSSQFGANLPDLMWVDMEHLLRERGLISFGALAASPGGYEDSALGMLADSRQLVLDAIARNQLRYLDDEDLADSINTRMKIYLGAASGAPIKAYINVGGGAASVGRTAGKKRYRPGLNLKPSDYALEIDSVMTRFAKQGTPVIHLVEAVDMAEVFGLPVAPAKPPAVGSGGVFRRQVYNPWLTLGVLLAVGFALRAFVLTGLGVRLRRLMDGAKSSRAPALEAGSTRAPDAEMMV